MSYFRRWILVALCLFTFSANAHQSSHSQILVDVENSTLSGYWNISLRDLDLIIELDKDGNGNVSWQELSGQQQIIKNHISHYLKFIQNNSFCPVQYDDVMVDKISTGVYAYFPFSAKCAEYITLLEIKYNLLFDIDAQHKALITLTSENNTHNVVMSTDKRDVSIDLSVVNNWRMFTDYVSEGLWHILIGIDHLLFVICLLLTAVLVYRNGCWHSSTSFKSVVFDVAKIVTVFTIAHSITLSLSVFGVIKLPSQIVESIIAASVIIVALNNIFPTIHKKIWVLVFLFGLIHGLGFASVLADLGLPTATQGLALLGFNIGVEIGQLALVVIALPILFVLSQKIFYRRLAMQLGSALIACLAMVWFIERAGDLELISWI